MDRRYFLKALPLLMAITLPQSKEKGILMADTITSGTLSGRKILTADFNKMKFYPTYLNRR